MAGLVYFCVDAGRADGFAHGFEFFVGPVFYRTLAFVVYDDCTLLSLLGAVAADMYECFYHMIEGIEVVVVHYEVFQLLIHHIYQYFLLVLFFLAVPKLWENVDHVRLLLFATVGAFTKLKNLIIFDPKATR